MLTSSVQLYAGDAAELERRAREKLDIMSLDYERKVKRFMAFVLWMIR